MAKHRRTLPPHAPLLVTFWRLLEAIYMAAALAILCRPVVDALTYFAS
ncbi:hypothetical protein [Nonomuraea sp. NPDC050202]